MEQKPQWPIEPEILRRIKSKNDESYIHSKSKKAELENEGQFPEEKNAETNDLNNNGVFSRESILSFIAVLSKDKAINNPAVVFEFIPTESVNNYKSEGEYKFELSIENEIIKSDSFHPFFTDKIKDITILRTDSDLFHCSNEVCVYYRKIKGNNAICKIQDSLVLFNVLYNNEFKNHNKKGIKIYREDYKTTLEHYLNDYHTQYPDKPRITIHDESKYHPYLKYTCIITGYTEYCFPIFLEDKIIACLVLGGIIEESKENMLKPDSLLSILKKELQNLPDFNAVTFDDKVNKQYDNSLKSNEFIPTIIKHLVLFEDRLEKRVSLQKHGYVVYHFSEINHDFLKKIQEGKTPITDLKELNPIIEKTLKKVTTKFCFDSIKQKNGDPKYGFIRLFAIDDFNKETTVLKLIAASDRERISNNNYTFDLAKIPESIRNSKESIANYENGINALDFKKGLFLENKPISTDEFEEKDVLRFYPAQSPRVKFVIWKRYVYDKDKHENGDSMFKFSMFNLYNYISSAYVALWESMLEKRLIDSVRIAAHESNQIIPAIQSSLRNNFDDSLQMLSNIRSGVLSVKVEEIQHHLELLRFVQVNHSLAFKEIKITERTENDILNLFYKLKNMYGKQLQFQKNNLVLIEGTKHRTVLGNTVLIEHVINNLIDNAVKYCYTGTNIQYRTEEKDNNFILHIISIGPEIEKEDDIYKLYSRGKNINKEGNGIGLYICKQIIEAHGWKIQNKSEQIKAPFNIACMAAYALSPSPEKYDVSIQFKEAIKLFKYEEFQNYLCLDDIGKLRYYPDPYSFKEINEQPSFKNDFYITIPKKIIP